jgi:hypothetical protein
MQYTSQTQNKPFARAKKILNYVLKLCTYEALQWRSFMTEIINGEKQYTLWSNKRTKNFSTLTALDEVVVS